MSADGLMVFSPLWQQTPGRAGATVHGLDTGARRCKEVSSQKPNGVERSSTCLWDQGLWPSHSLSLQVVQFAHPCLQAGFF